MQPTVRPAVPYVGPEHDVKLLSGTARKSYRKKKLYRPVNLTPAFLLLSKDKRAALLPCEPSTINGNRVAVNVVRGFRSKENSNAFQIIRQPPSSSGYPF